MSIDFPMGRSASSWSPCRKSPGGTQGCRTIQRAGAGLGVMRESACRRPESEGLFEELPRQAWISVCAENPGEVVGSPEHPPWFRFVWWFAHDTRPGGGCTVGLLESLVVLVHPERLLGAELIAVRQPNLKIAVVRSSSKE